MDLKVVGNKTPRVEGPDKVTGRATYAADINLPGILWAKILRSSVPHARIVSIDTSEAEQLDGVHAVITGQDQHYFIGRTYKDAPVLAFDKVRFVGDRVAAVAAETADIAELAISLIEVEYAELPGVFDALSAKQSTTAPVHDDPASYAGAPDVPAELRKSLPNLCAYTKMAKGDTEAAFAAADHLFEHSFSTQQQHHGYIEPHACLISVAKDGSCDIWASNKSPYMLRMQIASSMGLEQTSIRVHPIHVGGDFGGKGTPMDTPVIYLLSKACGRPVKLVMTYTEELLAANSRHPGTLCIQSAVNHQGELQAMKFSGLFAGGAYGCHRPLPNNNIHGIDQVGSCYRVPNIEIESSIFYTNTLPSGHMRSPGGPQINLAVEAHLDLIAKEMNIDRAEFRLNNLLREGDASPLGEKWLNIKARETLQGALDAVDWPNRPTPANTGWGIAMYERTAIGGDSSCKIRLSPDGTLEVIVPIPDPGQGAYTAIQQMVAEELGVEASKIGIVPAGTDELKFDMGVGGSRTTMALGITTTAAARELQATLAKAMAEKHNFDAESASWEHGQLRQAEHSWTFDTVAAETASGDGQPILIDWYQQIPFMPDPPETAFSAQIAHVRVDPETGAIEVLKLVTAHDVSTIVNPIGHQGQIEGGALFGLGGALIEDHRIEEGLPIALHLGEYKIPCALDIPPLETILLKREKGPGPFNIGAIAESANVPTASAITNAVADAISKPIYSLPLNAEKILALINE